MRPDPPTSAPAAVLPALVEPGAPLSPLERSRWARHLALPGFGEDAQRRLRAARVAVVGAGGLGCPVLSYLAAAGVGELVVVDDDVVEESNLQRQVLHRAGDVGRAKVDSVADALAASAPWVRVRPVRARLDAQNADELLAGADLVVDGADNFATRYAVADACGRSGAPEVFGSLLGFDAQVGAFWPGHGPTYRDVFPTPPPPGSVASCAVGGVLGALCGVVGSVMATEAVKLVTGTGQPLVGRLLVVDAASMRWRELAVRAPSSPRRPQAVPDDARPPTADLPPDALVGVDELARQLDGPHAPLLVDVRTPGEQVAGVLPGARALPLADVLADPGGVPVAGAGGGVVLYCRSGVRSAQAVAALRAAGRRDVASLDGGLLAWAARQPSDARTLGG